MSRACASCARVTAPTASPCWTMAQSCASAADAGRCWSRCSSATRPADHANLGHAARVLRIALGTTDRRHGVRAGTTWRTGVRVLVIANAVGERNREQAEWRLPIASAFDAGEVKAVAAWVKRGGSLLL